MRSIPYVMPDEAALARYMETKLLGAPPEAGILFVGVSVGVSVPEQGMTGRQARYDIWVGVTRDLEEGTVGPLVQTLLKEEVTQGLLMSIHAHRGQARKQSS